MDDFSDWLWLSECADSFFRFACLGVSMEYRSQVVAFPEDERDCDVGKPLDEESTDPPGGMGSCFR